MPERDERAESGEPDREQHPQRERERTVLRLHEGDHAREARRVGRRRHDRFQDGVQESGRCARGARRARAPERNADCVRELLALAFAVTATPSADAHPGHGSAVGKAAFHDAMRKLWEDHVTWTRQFIVSAATESGNLADIGPTTDRLLANQTDIGNALKPFYGDAVGEQVTALLRDLADAGIRFRDLATSQSSLEEIFVDLVRHGQ